jgi:hypothetical protein
VILILDPYKTGGGEGMISLHGIVFQTKYYTSMFQGTGSHHINFPIGHQTPETAGMKRSQWVDFRFGGAFFAAFPFSFAGLATAAIRRLKTAITLISFRLPS